MNIQKEKAAVKAAFSGTHPTHPIPAAAALFPFRRLGPLRGRPFASQETCRRE